MAATDTATRKPGKSDGPLDSSLIEHVVGYQLAIATVMTRQVYQERIGAPHELRPVEFTLLMLLLGNPGASPKQLGRALRLPAPNVTVLIDRMAGRGLVERRRSSTDGRALEVLLTADGETLARCTHAVSLTMESDLLGRFTPGERVMLRELLARLGDGAAA
jgi:DNA-binding MarR family transcriptional regulator